MALTRATDKIIANADGNLNLSGIVTASSFVGKVTGAVTPSGDVNVGSNIKLGAASGIITATSFSGDGSNLTSLPAGLGTALSSTQTSPLNKLYYTNEILSIGATVTVDHPATGTGAYTQYADLRLEEGADLIIEDGDDVIPDILGLGTDGGGLGAGGTGRIRVDSITNKNANGAPNFPNGLTGTAGTFTTGTFSGAISAASGTITGNLGVGGVLTYEDVTNVDSVGLITARAGINLVGNDLNVGSNIKIGNASGIVTATSYSGSGENLTRTTQLSHRNLILNGRFDVFQRFLPGSQVVCNSGSNTYCMDRWYARGEGSKGVFTFFQQDIQSEGQGAHAAARVQVTTTSTPSTDDVYKISQRIEGVNVRHLHFGTSSAKTITLSFLVKSTVTGTHGGSLMNSAQNRAYPFTYTISSANTWEQKSITIPGDTGGTWVTNTGIGLELNFDMGTAESNYRRPAGSWYAGRAEGADGAVQLITQSSANWYVTRVQLEVGTVSTPFENIPYPDELARCQRYYYMHARGSSNWIGVATVYQDNNLFCHVKFPVTMRSNPSRDVANGSSYFLAYSNGGNDGFNTFSGSWNTQTNGTGLNAYSNDGVSGRSAGHSAMIITNHADAYLGFNADL